MGRYTLTKRIYSTLKGRGYNLVCKMCNRPLHIGECIESKPNKYKMRKFYHCECYDNSFIDVEGPDDDVEE